MTNLFFKSHMLDMFSTFIREQSDAQCGQKYDVNEVE